MTSQEPTKAYTTAEEVMTAIIGEFVRIRRDPNKGPYNSTHEGMGVLLEEWDEFKDEVRANNVQNACKEAVQIAAAAMSFIIDFKEPMHLQGCTDCKFVNKCFGPRKNGCRRFPEEKEHADV